MASKLQEYRRMSEEAQRQLTRSKEWIIVKKVDKKTKNQEKTISA